MLSNSVQAFCIAVLRIPGEKWVLPQWMLQPDMNTCAKIFNETLTEVTDDCRSIWNSNHSCSPQLNPSRLSPVLIAPKQKWKIPSQGQIQDFEMGVNFCNNAREIKYYFNIWGIRKKEGGSEKRGVKIHPFHLPWIRACILFSRSFLIKCE